MILAIDVGNTNITIGCIDGDEILNVYRMSSDISKTEYEYAVGIKDILAFHNLQHNDISGSVISCVVPPLTDVIKRAVNQLAGIDAITVGAGIKTGINILIDDPGQLGSDMVATAVGALKIKKPPLIIADMGTATKMTVIDKTGSFIGGAILPGITLSMNALAAGTSQLPRVPIEAPAKCISANTVDCMKSGAVFGAAAMIDGMAERFENELGQPALIIATGGLAGAVYRFCKREIIHDPHLIMRGLTVIYEKNCQKPASKHSK